MDPIKSHRQNNIIKHYNSGPEELAVANTYSMPVYAIHRPIGGNRYVSIIGLDYVLFREPFMGVKRSLGVVEKSSVQIYKEYLEF